jgi:Cu-Zn family superoxide dismutase
MALAAACGLPLLGCSNGGNTPADMSTPGPQAVATINEPGGAQGTATFEETADGVKITVNLTSVPSDGMLGMHIHATGDCSDTMGDGGTHHGSAGGHFNPDNVNHGCPTSNPHHAGDLGNITISGGKGVLQLTSKDLTVSAGARTVVGKAIILHQGADDCTTQPTGNSGSRIGCGVIAAK